LGVHVQVIKANIHFYRGKKFTNYTVKKRRRRKEQHSAIFFSMFSWKGIQGKRKLN